MKVKTTGLAARSDAKCIPVGEIGNKSQLETSSSKAEVEDPMHCYLLVGGCPTRRRRISVNAAALPAHKQFYTFRYSHINVNFTWQISSALKSPRSNVARYILDSFVYVRLHLVLSMVQLAPPHVLISKKKGDIPS